MKHTRAATTGVTIQPAIIFPKTCHFTAVIPCKMDIPKIAPTTACELETGTNGIVGSPYLITMLQVLVRQKGIEQ